MKPIFQLLNYKFPLFLFSENMSFDPKKAVAPELITWAALNCVDKGKDVWKVTVSVKTPDDIDMSTFPFRMSIIATGIIQTGGETPDAASELRKKRLLYVNATSILYAAIRDRLSQFTCRPEYGMYLLPTFRFDPNDIKEEQKSEEIKKKAEKDKELKK